jgi:redox-sensitive bicupin YhaK (pirin superfamily)
MVGAFIFLDQIGDDVLPPEKPISVLPHPHIGLSTVTYLFKGAMTHRDSAGVVQDIHPGDVNWMTAGSGVVHSERTPEQLRGNAQEIFGLQLWVALPKEVEDIEPSFQHLAKENLPAWSSNDIEFRLIVGAAFGKTSPVQVFSKLFYVDVRSTRAQTLSIEPSDLIGERAAYVVEGTLFAENQTINAGNMIVFKNNIPLQMTVGSDSRLMLLGGEPLAEKRYIWWNFVSSSEEKIERAKLRWKTQQFPKITGETEFVPLPDEKR